MSDLLHMNVEKSDLEKKINRMLEDFRERYPGVSLDVEPAPLRRHYTRSSNVALVLRRGDSKW